MLCRSCWLSTCALGSSGRDKLLAVFQLLGHRLHEAIHRRAQLIHQLLDLVVAGAAFERLLQRVLGIAQRVLRVGNVAVLERRPPSATAAPPRRADRRRSWRAPATRRSSAGRDRRRPRGVNFSGAMASASSAVMHERPRIGVEREIAPLLDQRARQRLGENALRQAERERLALADVAAFVMGDERHRHFGAGPRDDR